MTRSIATRLGIAAMGLALSPLAACSCGNVCGANTSLNDKGECVAPAPTPPIECAAGTVLSDGSCVVENPVTCGPGTTANGDECVPENPLQCGPGTIAEDGDCIVENPILCGPGTQDDGTGTCEPINVTTCGAGTIDNGSSVCVPEVPFGAAPAAPNVGNPFDAAPSPDGTIIFFTARSEDGESFSLFSVPSDGTAPQTELARAFNAPLGIAVSSDGNTVFVADAGDEGGATTDPDDCDTDGANCQVINGGLFAVDFGGNNAVSRVGAVDGFAIKGMDLRDNGGTDVITFSGIDPADGVKGVFSIDVGGTSVTTVYKSVHEVACLEDDDCGAGGPTCVGAASPVTGECQLADGSRPLGDPSGIAVDTDGNVYVSDTSGAADGNLAVFQIDVDGNVTALAQGGLHAGYPTGTALSLDETRLLVSSVDDDTNAQVLVIDLANGNALSATSTGIGGNDEAGGLHRAAETSDFAWCGVSATGGNGIVFRVQLF